MDEEKIIELVLEEQGITFTDKDTKSDYILGTQSTADGYEIFCVWDNKYNLRATENGGEDAVFMYESGVYDEIADIIKNNSGICLCFLGIDKDDAFSSMDWEDIAGEVGVDIEEEEEEEEE